MAQWINSRVAVGATAVSLPAAAKTLNGAAPSYLRIAVEDQAIRVRFDGTAPTSGGTIGVVYAAAATDEFYLEQDATFVTNFRAIEEVGGSPAVLQIAARF